MNYYFKTQQIKTLHESHILFKIMCVRTKRKYEQNSVPWSAGYSMTARTLSRLLENSIEELQEEFKLDKPNSILFFPTRQEARKFIDNRLIPAVIVKKLIE